jgi:hypothetical protein
MKTTSKNLEKYQSEPCVDSDVILFEKGKCELFEVATAIQLNNLFAIPHSHLSSYEKQGVLEVLGILDDEFLKLLREAIADCKAIERNRKQRLLAILDGREV